MCHVEAYSPMARTRKKSSEDAPPPVAPAPAPAVTVYEATLGAPGTGSVIRVPPPIAEPQAVVLRRAGGEIVVCGANLAANRAAAQAIEQAAVGAGNWIRHPPHLNAGPNALPHFQPNPRPPAGHSFYETPNRQAQ